LGGPEKGFGVLGVAHNDHDRFTMAGVRGVTRDDKTWWTLEETPDKGILGVLGQALDVAVWGESKRSFGVVGSTMKKFSLAGLPTKPAGVLGISEYADANGVLGKSLSLKEKDAGVLAEGNGGGNRPQAAALEIRNGAIRVSGASRPAGIVTTTMDSASVLVSCTLNCPNCDHSHNIGFYKDLAISNDLVVPESIIQLTVQAPIGTQSIFGAHIAGIQAGVIQIRVALTGQPFRGPCIPPNPAMPVKIHYLIINPD